MNKVLIVEDNVPLCNLYSRILEQINAEVTQTHSCRQALDYLKSNTPQLLLLDMGLPDGSGQLVIDYIKANLPKNATQIIVISGNEHHRTPELLAQVDQVLLKPVSTVVLVDLVREFKQARAA